MNVDFACVLETVPTEKAVISLFNEDKSKKENDEFMLKLEAWIDDKEDEKKEEAEFIVIVDRSGSMTGQPWHQVQQALIKMLQVTGTSANINVTTMAYNHDAEYLPIIGQTNVDNKTIHGIRATGSTNFVAVFNKLLELFKSDKIDPSKAYSIFFMTDGEDTCNNSKQIMQAKETLQTVIEKSGASAIVHVLGFSENHDEEFLESLALLGTADGTYSFVSPKEGEKALEERIIALIESISSFVGRNIRIQITGENLEFLGDKIGEVKTEVVIPAVLTRENEKIKIDTKKFVRIKDGSEPKFTLKVLEGRKNVDGEKANVVSVDNVVLETQADIDDHNLIKMRTKINQIVADEESDKTAVKKSYEDLEKSFKGLKIDFNNVSKRTARRHGAVETGLKLLKEIYDPSFGDYTERERFAKRKGAATSYGIMSRQIANIQMQCKSSESASRMTNKWRGRSRSRDKDSRYYGYADRSNSRSRSPSPSTSNERGSKE